MGAWAYGCEPSTCALRGQWMQVSSLLSPCRSREPNLGLQAWQKSPYLHAKLSHDPTCYLLTLHVIFWPYMCVLVSVRFIETLLDASPVASGLTAVLKYALRTIQCFECHHDKHNILNCRSPSTQVSFLFGRDTGTFTTKDLWKKQRNILHVQS